MKTFKKILLAFAIFAMVIPVFNSCKKGTEDPFLSFRSRDRRIEGTWTLKSMDYSYSSNSTTVKSNTVNNDTYNGAGLVNFTVNYDGTNMIASKTDNSNATSTYQQFTYPSYASKSTVSKDEKTEIWTSSYSITVSIYNDNTYSYTKTRKAISYVRTDRNTTGNITISKDTSVTGTYNGVNYLKTDDETKTDVGTWQWVDDENSGKDKIMINAGPLAGFLVRLSNKELTIDHSFGTFSNFFVEDASYQYEMTEDDNTNQVINAPTYEDTYNNSSPGTYANGTETTTTTNVKKVVSGKSTWEKTDKGRKREDGASAE